MTEIISAVTIKKYYYLRLIGIKRLIICEILVLNTEKDQAVSSMLRATDRL